MPCSGSAQRRPGREPRRHASRRCSLTGITSAQRRPGREPRRHAVSAAMRRSRLRSLNEGRGANPGDTPVAGLPKAAEVGRSTKAGARTPATQAARCEQSGDCRRSTKAGARTPATLDIADGSLVGYGAQRRPGREPRRHPAGSVTPSSLIVAQRRPGREPRRHPMPRVHRRRAAKDAQRRPGREPRRHALKAIQEGRADTARSTKAGARTPATRVAMPHGETRLGAAQRRPGREPRRHPVARADALAVLARSTKAGARTPATPPVAGRRARAEHQFRSTKAGARTPATLPIAHTGGSTRRNCPIKRTVGARYSPQLAGVRLAPGLEHGDQAGITGGSRKWSQHPRLTEFVTLASADAQRDFFDSAGEPIHDHRIALAVDDIFDITDQPSQPRCGESALEDRELYPLAVFPANIGDASEPGSPSPLRLGDVVSDEDVHRFHDNTNGGYAGRSPRKWRASNVA